MKAIAEANPLNSDLQNFISNKDYLKDRGSNDGYNVGVTWNTESTSRVKSFFIDDGRTQTVTTMDVSALSGLEQLDLQNTRLKSLDLSTLTKLRSLSLYGNDFAYLVYGEAPELVTGEFLDEWLYYDHGRYSGRWQ